MFLWISFRCEFLYCYFDVFGFNLYDRDVVELRKNLLFMRLGKGEDIEFLSS